MLKELLKNRTVILSSASPRREQLVKGLDIDFAIELNGETEEVYDASMDPSEVPEYLSNLKSLHFGRVLTENEILITADTMVLCNGEILGKPADRDDAVRILSKLSGNRHTVITGVTLRSVSSQRTFSATTDVWFRKLSQEEIYYYIDNYKPYDKAGAYGAQDWIGYIAIEKIEGSYFNVMGLPVQKLYRELEKFAADPLSN
ncbi:MAG: septum formation protein Maf [Bacteroidetes bacterium HGW-Bacteroidetes-14]|jgi:septum formation protein|nr:MAG: septum formation protein Maf [Bacteroidetes bacterium HGW-Bacteroidetes-14]